MNKIVIGSHAIPIKEYNGQRVVTFKDIDAVHGRPEGTARKRFNDNKDRFIENVDFFKVKCSEVRPFFGQTLPNGFNPNADLILITETGYLMLVKSFTDDLAWQVQRELVNCYFRVKREESKVYKPTRPLTTDDYEEAARTIAKCHNSRLPIVIDLYRKAGFDIEQTIVNMETKEIRNDVSELVELLNKFTLTELCRLLPICKSSIYYYRAGKYIPRPERCEEIINILKRR